MKRLLFFLSLCLTLCAVCAYAAPADTKTKKEKKDKKEKTAYVWDWDGTRSGDKDFDDYLVAVDNLWKNMQTYSATYEQYTYCQDTLSINGKYYVMAYMRDKNGNKVTRSQANWQVYHSVLAGTSIVLDATNASLLTASATLALPNLGLNAIFFGKYIKGGPLVIARGTKEMAAIAKTNKANARAWKAAQAASVDPATLGVFSDEVVEKMNKCCYLKEIIVTDPEYTVVVETMTAKSEEQMQADLAALGDSWEKSIVLPEDANQSLDDLDNLDDLDDLN